MFRTIIPIGGIALATDEYGGPEGAVIRNNTISDNTGDGLYAWYCGDATIKGNTIENNTGWGMYLDHSFNNLIRGNSVRGNSEDGIYIEGGLAGRRAAEADYAWIEVNRGKRRRLDGRRRRRRYMDEAGSSASTSP